MASRGALYHFVYVRRFQKLGSWILIGSDTISLGTWKAAKIARPLMTVACDVEHRRDLRRVVDQAYRRIAGLSEYVVVVPKDRRQN